MARSWALNSGMSSLLWVWKLSRDGAHVGGLEGWEVLRWLILGVAPSESRLDPAPVSLGF